MGHLKFWGDRSPSPPRSPPMSGTIMGVLVRHGFTLNESIFVGYLSGDNETPRNEYLFIFTFPVNRR